MTGLDGGAARLVRVYAAWIVLVTAVVIAAALGVGLTAERVYRSEAIVVVESRVRANTTPVAPDMGTEKELASSGVVVDPAARNLGISPGQLLEGLVVGVAPDANVLTFGYTDADPRTAQNRAETLAMAYVAYRNSSEAASARTGSPAASTQHATLITDAVVAGTPVDRSVWINVGVGLALGLLLGVGTALIRDRTSDRIRGRADFERISGTTVLATVPRQRRRRGDGEAPDILRVPESPAAESYRYLRSRLLPHLRDPGTILVTSAGRGEGRTTTAANLAVAMAQIGLRVTLIDADLRDPRLHTVFGVDNGGGLTSVLAGEDILGQTVRQTSVERLRLLSAGPAAGNAGDLLVESRLRPVLDALRATSDLVILDSGPVLGVSDPITLAAVCDHVLLVGDYRRTTRRYLARALGELADVVHGNVSGVLLNAPRGAGGPAPHGRPQEAGAMPIPGPVGVQPNDYKGLGVAPRAAPPPTIYSSAFVAPPTITEFVREEPGPASGSELPVAGRRTLPAADPPAAGNQRLTRRG